MEQKGIVHRRLIRGTKPLQDELIKLGFKKVGSEYRGLREITKYKLGDKYIFDSYDHMYLMEGINLEKPKVDHLDFKVIKMVYQGLSVHDEMLKFWALRNPINNLVDETKERV